MEHCEKKYKRSPDIVFRSLVNEAILVPIRRNLADMDSIYTLNEVGLAVWNLLDGEHTIEQIAATLSECFEVNNNTARKDVEDFIKTLEAADCIHPLPCNA